MYMEVDFIKIEQSYTSLLNAASHIKSLEGELESIRSELEEMQGEEIDILKNKLDLQKSDLNVVFRKTNVLHKALRRIEQIYSATEDEILESESHMGRKLRMGLVSYVALKNDIKKYGLVFI